MCLQKSPGKQVREAPVWPPDLRLGGAVSGKLEEPLGTVTACGHRAFFTEPWHLGQNTAAAECKLVPQDRGGAEARGGRGASTWLPDDGGLGTRAPCKPQKPALANLSRRNLLKDFGYLHNLQVAPRTKLRGYPSQEHGPNCPRVQGW